MSHTLLELVQTIASSMDSDTVNSINDTTESLQLAYIIRDSYNDIASRIELPKHYNFFQLTASGSSTQPTVMTLPEAAKSLEWVRYDYTNYITEGLTSPKFTLVQFQPLDVFLEHMKSLNADTMTNVTAFTYSSNDFQCYNDQHPTFYTSYNDTTIIFNAYKSTEDTTLQAAKTQGYGELTQTFSLTDGFVIPFDERQYNLLVNEAKSQAFAELKQAQNAKAEARARRGWIATQHNKQKVKSYRYQDQDLPDYGWKRR